MKVVHPRRIPFIPRRAQQGTEKRPSHLRQFEVVRGSALWDGWQQNWSNDLDIHALIRNERETLGVIFLTTYNKIC